MFLTWHMECLPKLLLQDTLMKIKSFFHCWILIIQQVLLHNNIININFYVNIIISRHDNGYAWYSYGT